MKLAYEILQRTRWVCNVGENFRAFDYKVLWLVLLSKVDEVDLL